MAKAKDITGRRFGRLLVLARAGRNGRRALWLCACDCGNQTQATTAHLKTGAKKSCGCWRKEQLAAVRPQPRHRMFSTPEYRAWINMRTRCQRPSWPQWQNYGGRGIRVCERWQKFENFFADMGKRPSAKHSIDRVNNDGNYEPSNCRWATRAEQHSNTTRTRYHEAFGKSMTIPQWAAQYGLHRDTVRHRLKRGWSLEDALVTPPQSRESRQQQRH